MKLTVNNFRGVTHAEVNLDAGVTLIAGENGAGKSSILQALGCLVTTKDIPYQGMHRKDAAQLVNNRAERGTAELVDSTGAVKLEWPSCKRTISTGAPLSASAWAAGLALPSSIPPAQFAEVLGSKPTFDDFEASLMGVGEAPIERIWEGIERNGWDVMHSEYKAEGAELKGMWRQVTGENYGSDKARAWTPADWISNDIPNLESALAAAETALTEAQSKNAISAHERTSLETLAASVNTALESANVCLGRYDGACEAVEMLRERIADVSANSVITYECPECKTVLTLTEEKLHKHDGKKTTKKQLAEAKKQIEALAAELKHAEEQRDLSRAAYDATVSAYNESLNAVSKLENLPAQVEDIAQYRYVVDTCANQLRAGKDKVQADQINGQISVNQLIVQALAPTGVRQTVLQRSLDEFNGILAEISMEAEWGCVCIDEELNIKYDNRLYAVLSQSEQYRTDFTLRCALSVMDGSGVVIADGADVLDAGGRSGVMAVADRLWANAGIRTVIGATMPKAQFDGIEGFNGYWVEHGRAA